MRTLMSEPGPDDVDWLATRATRGDIDHARWELRYLRRALGVLVAQRDSLDDRTPSEVLRALLHRMHKRAEGRGSLSCIVQHVRCASNHQRVLEGLRHLTADSFDTGTIGEVDPLQQRCRQFEIR